MSDNRPVYLLVPLGTAPAIVAEVLWYLTVKEQRRVYGVELWVTHSEYDEPASKQSLQEALKSDNHASPPKRDIWSRLTEAAGESARLLPELHTRFKVRKPEPMRPIEPGLVVFGFSHEEEPLSDVHTGAEAVSVARQLHDRVRFLCATLDDVVLIGSIAGGRKNFGSALQGAFELQGRPTDELVHVLLHPDIESRPQLFRSYVVPEGEVAGVATGEQIRLFRVPFPPLRTLLDPDEWKVALDRDDVVDLWERLRHNHGKTSEVHARLEARQKHGVLVFSGGELKQQEELRLTGGCAELYAAIVALSNEEMPSGTQFRRWGKYIDAHRIGRRPAAPKPIHRDTVADRLPELKRATAELRRMGLEAFAVEGNGQDSRVPAAERVKLPWP